MTIRQWQGFHKYLYFLTTQMQNDGSENGGSDIVQLQELSLFEEDPYVEQISLIEDKPEPINESMHLLECENILQKKPCRVVIEGDSVALRGQFQALVSNYRIMLFTLTYGSPELKKEKREIPVSIPFSFMSEIDLVKRQIAIKMKTGLQLKIKPSLIDFQNLYQLLLKGYMAIPFFSLRIFQEEESLTYDTLAELQRMRMNWSTLIIVNNSNGHLCATYPKYFIVPKKVESNLLQECLRIRNDRRVPVATYYWPECKVALWRGARVKAGLESNKFNQAYLKEISREPFIIQLNEQLGFREPKGAKFTSYTFKYMSVSGLNSLFQKIVVNYSKNDEIFKLLERWNEDIRNLIKCAYIAVYELKGGKQVLLQQNQGFDRNCQVSALAQLIIDPFYRTINGFSILVEKQFVSFGHPFHYRMGFEREKSQEESPIFIQFLECVSQLISTHPECFEFSSYYLARIAYEAYSAKYNNFYFNDEELKKKYEHILKTQNIWKHLPMKKQFYNYQWEEKMAVKPLICMREMPSVKQFLVWREFYDLVTELRCEEPDQIHVKKRRSSIYKMFRRNSIKSE